MCAQELSIDQNIDYRENLIITGSDIPGSTGRHGTRRYCRKIVAHVYPLSAPFIDYSLCMQKETLH